MSLLKHSKCKRYSLKEQNAIQNQGTAKRAISCTIYPVSTVLVFQGPEGCVFQEAGPGGAQEPRSERGHWQTWAKGVAGVAQDGRGGGQQGRIKHQHQLWVGNLSLSNNC